MALSYKARRRWSLVVLLLGLPAYIIMAVWLMSFFEERPSTLVEILIYSWSWRVVGLPFEGDL